MVNKTCMVNKTFSHIRPMQAYSSPKQYVQFMQLVADVCICHWPNGSIACLFSNHFGPDLRLLVKLH